VQSGRDGGLQKLGIASFVCLNPERVILSFEHRELYFEQKLTIF